MHEQYALRRVLRLVLRQEHLRRTFSRLEHNPCACAHSISICFSSHNENLLSSVTLHILTMDILKHVQALHPTISKIQTLSGSPGISIGVLHHGEILHTAHFGQQDVGLPTPQMMTPSTISHPL
jgi:hypothetical protein